MKLNGWMIGSVGLLAVLALRSPYGAPLALMGVTLAIFFGTLSLRKPPRREATSTHPGL